MHSDLCASVSPSFHLAMVITALCHLQKVLRGSPQAMLSPTAAALH